jgi:hypothetical protein
MENLASYVRAHRPDDAKLEYERMIRLTLNWLDTHKIKEKSVFLNQEGKEYNAMLNFLEDRLGVRPSIEKELFDILYTIKETK